MLYVIEGELRVAFVEENGGKGAVVNAISPGEVFVVPQGLIHYQQNLGCEAATFLAALNNEDPGAVTITTRFFELPNEAIQVKRVSLRLGGRSRRYKCFIIASPLPRYHQRRGTRGLGFRRPQPTTVHVNNPGEIA